ncbi:hypothetical protein E2C01_063354 [Portunus trituberculatus]|uniref:Uncharacterized protein n=1 Tax=Portunus trituberculatus TaxID=210409 RepID=A0A5B7HHC9_PORTR|nr:hypothetical protein [Portunus trituberculatus]
MTSSKLHASLAEEGKGERDEIALAGVQRRRKGKWKGNETRGEVMLMGGPGEEPSATGQSASQPASRPRVFDRQPFTIIHRPSVIRLYPVGGHAGGTAV